MPAYKPPKISGPSVFDNPITKGLKKAAIKMGLNEPDVIGNATPMTFFGEQSLSGPAKALFRHLREWTQTAKGAPVDPLPTIRGSKVTSRNIPRKALLPAPTGFEHSPYIKHSYPDAGRPVIQGGPGRATWGLEVERGKQLAAKARVKTLIQERPAADVPTIKSIDELSTLTNPGPRTNLTPTKMFQTKGNVGKNASKLGKGIATKETVRAIRALHKEGLSYGQIADKMGMKLPTVRSIAVRDSYAWLKD